jgi:hypothetical protein
VQPAGDAAGPRYTSVTLRSRDYSVSGAVRPVWMWSFAISVSSSASVWYQCSTAATRSPVARRGCHVGRVAVRRVGRPCCWARRRRQAGDRPFRRCLAGFVQDRCTALARPVPGRVLAATGRPCARGWYIEVGEVGVDGELRPQGGILAADAGGVDADQHWHATIGVRKRVVGRELGPARRQAP